MIVSLIANTGSNQSNPNNRRGGELNARRLSEVGSMKQVYGVCTTLRRAKTLVCPLG